MPAFGVIGADFHRGLDVFSIKAVDEARLADPEVPMNTAVSPAGSVAPVSSRLAR